MLLGEVQAAAAPTGSGFEPLKRQGRACYRSRRYRCALEKFEAAFAVEPTAEMRFNVASAQDKLGLAALAVRTFRRYLEEAGAAAQPRALLHIQRRLPALLKQVAQLRLELRPPEVQLAINGSPFELQDAPVVDGVREVVLEAGTHELQLSAQGYISAKQTLTLSRGEVRRLAVLLMPVSAQPGSLAVDSQPSGARVKIDGKLHVGKTPTHLRGLAPGWHVVELARGLLSQKTRLRIEPGRQTTISVELRPTTMELQVQSDPPGARLQLDGRDMGVTPLVSTVAAGEHTLVLEKAGYQRQLRTLQVTGSSPARLQVKQRLDPLPVPGAPTLAGAVLPAPGSELPLESGYLRSSVSLTFSVGKDDVTAYRFGFEANYLIGRRLLAGLYLPLAIHGLTVVGDEVREETAFGNIVAKLRLGLTRSDPGRLAMAAYAHLLAPTVSSDVPNRSFFGLRAGVAATAQLGALTLNGDLGGEGMVFADADDYWLVLANAYAAFRLHRYLALGLAVQVGVFVQPLLDQPALSLMPQLTFLPSESTPITLAVRAPLNTVGRVYTLYAPAVFLLSVGYRF